MRIREASKEDVNEIAELLLEEFSKSPFNEKASMNSVIKSVDFYLEIGKGFVAVEENIIGVVIFKVEQWWEGPVVLVEDLAVRESYRGEGVGRSLMDKVEEYGREVGAKIVNVLTTKKCEAVDFYSNRGYEKDNDTLSMSKKLE